MAYSNGAMTPWVPNMRDGFLTLDFATRYFSTSRTAEAMPFDEAVDPLGILAGVASDAFRHTAENEVIYHEKVVDSDLERRVCS